MGYWPAMGPKMNFFSCMQKGAIWRRGWLFRLRRRLFLAGAVAIRAMSAARAAASPALQVVRGGEDYQRSLEVIVFGGEAFGPRIGWLRSHASILAECTCEGRAAAVCRR